MMGRAEKRSGAIAKSDEDKDNQYYNVDFIFASTAQYLDQACTLMMMIRWPCVLYPTNILHNKEI